MASQVVRAALGELDRQLELARDVLRQLEAEIGHTGYQGGGWENPSEALPYLLDQLQESLLVLLEIAELLPVAGSPPGSSRRTAVYSPVLRLTADAALALVYDVVERVAVQRQHQRAADVGVIERRL